MKKILYIFMIALASSMAVTGCTSEDDVQPAKDPMSGSGGGAVIE